MDFSPLFKHQRKQLKIIYVEINGEEIFEDTKDYLKGKCGGVPGGLLVRIQGFHCCGPGVIPGWETDSESWAAWQNKKRTEENVASCFQIFKE